MNTITVISLVLIGMSVYFIYTLYLTDYIYKIKLNRIIKFRKKWQLAEIILFWNDDSDEMNTAIRENKMEISNLITTELDYVKILGYEEAKLLGLDSDDSLRRLITTTFNTVKITESKLTTSFSIIDKIRNEYQSELKALNI